MSWVRIDDHFPTHPKMISAGGDAAWLHICALCYCAEHLTDGFIPKAMVGRLSDRKGAQRLATRLVNVGSWVEHEDCYEIHDYLDFNPSRESVENVRRDARERRAKGGRRSADVRANAMNPDPTPPEVLTELPSRKRDLLFEAICESVGANPGQLTKAGRGSINAALKDLRAVEATPGEVVARAGQFKRRYPNAALTAPALAKHWATLGSGWVSPASEPTEEDQAELKALLEEMNQ